MKSKSATFSDSAYPLYFISRVFGLSPFSLIYKNGEVKRTRIGILDILWFVLSIFIYTAWFLFPPQVIPLKWQNTQISRNEKFMVTFAGLSKSIFSIMLDMYNRKRIIGIIVEISNFDKKVMKKRKKS